MNTITAPITSEVDDTVWHQPDPATVAAIEALSAAAETASVATKELAAGETGGLARRLTKLARQQHAASRLLARGTQLEVPKAARSIELSAKRSLTAGCGVSEVDYTIGSWERTIVELHRWRGHTACLPAED